MEAPQLNSYHPLPTDIPSEGFRSIIAKATVEGSDALAIPTITRIFRHPSRPVHRTTSALIYRYPSIAVLRAIRRIPLNLSATALCLLSFSSLALTAQQPRIYTTADYAQAEKFMSYNTAPLAYKGMVTPHWMADGRMWYRAVDDSGTTYRLVDPAKKSNTAAFDEKKLAVALNAASDKIKADPTHLRFNELSFSDSDHRLHLASSGFSFDCTLGATYTCASATDKSSSSPSAKFAPLNISPDKTKGAFIRDWNLWVRDMATGAETQLTTDGVKDYGYATDNAGWKQSDAAILLWSPDSKKIATFQQDQRKDGEMYLVPVTNGHPELKAWKYPLVGDENVTMIERVIIDLGAKKVIRLKMPQDQHRGSVCDDVACKGNTWEDVEWSPDATQLAFLSTARDHKREELRVADAATGEVRHVMAETAVTFLESGDGMVNWHALFASNEVVWFSDRDNWGQLYLYDLNSGRLKNQITHGEGNVTQVLHVDEKERIIYFLGVGKETGRDPYFVQLYSVHFDGTQQKLLTPEDANHAIAFSPDFAYFTDIASTPTTPATTVIRTNSGALAMEVAKQDISKLVASGWVPPTPITVKARDGKTDLYGFLFKPTKFDASKKYPVINAIYPGPQTGSCGPPCLHDGPS